MFDVLLDENKDLKFVNGDLVIGDVNQQNQELIVVSNKGDWKESPEIGVGINDYLNDENISGAISAIKNNLRYDGFKVNKVKLVNNKIEIDAKYPE